MVRLLTYAGPAAPDAPGPRTGGVPLAPAGFAWPVCATCGGNMQFVASTPVDAEHGVLVFLCQNDPGLCDEWDPRSGGNAAVLVSGDLRPADVPATGVTTLDEVSAIALVDHPGDDYETARATWGEGRRRDVLGQLGGRPSWLQGDETPECPGCASPMAFVAQFEEGHDARTAANFGGGSGYAFGCVPCGGAAFLFQS